MEQKDIQNIYDTLGKMRENANKAANNIVDADGLKHFYAGKATGYNVAMLLIEDMCRTKCIELETNIDRLETVK